MAQLIVEGSAEKLESIKRMLRKFGVSFTNVSQQEEKPKKISKKK